MDKREYGGSGLRVSRLAYGAMGIANDPGLKNKVAPSLLRALELGVNIVDTARIYPYSEEIIRNTIAEWSGTRPIISTKLAPARKEGFRFGGPVSDYYPNEGIRKSIENSLLALGTERLDIVHLHQWHYRWTHELEWLEALQSLQQEGKIGRIAISGQDHEHDALLEMVSSGLIDGIQIIVNLFESRPCNSILPLAEARSVGVIGRCVLDSGGLAGKFAPEDFESRPFLKNAPVTEYQHRLATLEQSFVPSAAASLPELAIRFALSHPAIASLALGMLTNEEVDVAVAAVNKGSLSNDVIDDIRYHHVWTKNFYERLL